jgi:ketosteroid isomerase-like protein
MSDAKLELAGAALDAWNRRDIEWLREHGTPDFEFVPAVAATVEGGSVKGPEGLARFFGEMDESWEEFRIEAMEFELVGELVFGRGRVIAKGRGSGLELDQPLGSVTTFEDDRIARLQSFLDPEQALATARSGEAA